MDKPVKIGIDYHGVLTANPDFFRSFCMIAIKRRCQIYIISGGPQKDIEEFVTKKQIPYSRIWSLVDYFDEQNRVQRFSDGSFKVDDNLWNAAKAEFCAKEKIDFHIDDSNLYGQYFTTPFCLYNTKDNTCLIHNQKISFTAKPEKVFEDIYMLLVLNKTCCK